MKRIVAVFLLLASWAFAAPYLSPVAIPWTPNVVTGVIGGIPTRPSGGGVVINMVADYGADPTGVTDCSALVQTAVNASHDYDVIYFPAGIFKMNSGVTIGTGKNNLVFRGANVGFATLTTINAFCSGVLFTYGRFDAASDYSWGQPQYANPTDTSANQVASGGTKGSTQVVIGDTTGFSAGQLIQFALFNQQDNTAITAGAVLVMDVKGQETSRRPMAFITSVPDGTHINFSPALPFDFDSGLPVYLNYPSGYNSGYGIENITIDGNSAATAVVWFRFCDGCWMSYVNAIHFTNYVVSQDNSMNFEAAHCTIEGTNVLSPNHGGFLMNHVNRALIYDNVVVHCFPPFEVNSSSVGNVIAYNFAYMSGGANIDTNHQPHNSHNLFEGNISPNMQCDGNSGSTSEDTFFRNWLTGTFFLDTGDTVPVGLNRFTRKYSFIGNIINNPAWTLGATGYSFGNPYLGNGYSFGTAQPSVGSYWLAWKDTGTLTANTRGTGIDYVANGTFNPGATTISLTGGTGTILAGDTLRKDGDGQYYQVSSGLSGGNIVIFPPLASQLANGDGFFEVNRGTITVTSDATIQDTPFWDPSMVISERVFLNLIETSDSTKAWQVVAKGQTGKAIDFYVDATISGNLPATSTAFNVWWSTTGYPELDRDTFWDADPSHPGTTNLKMNYNAWADGGNAIPSGQDIGSDTLPDSYYLAAKPSWFGSLSYPAFNPLAPGTVTSAGLVRIPAGWRFVNGNSNYLNGAGTLNTPTLNVVNLHLP